MSVEDDVRAAARALVADYGAGRVDEYFARLAPDATFVFYTAPERLESRDAYRRLWDQWIEEDGFRVLDCEVSNQLVQVLSDDVGLVTHEVATAVHTNEGVQALHELETIVFARHDEGWLVVYEHLSSAAD